MKEVDKKKIQMPSACSPNVTPNSKISALAALVKKHSVRFSHSLILSRGSGWGYLDNIKHLKFCFNNIKQLNFRLFNI